MFSLNRLFSFFKKKYPFFYQLDTMDCGPACLQMIASYYGYGPFKLSYLKEKCYATRNGVTLQGISYAAEEIGFRCKAINTSFERFRNHMFFPCIVFWRQRHFVVVYKLVVKTIPGGYKGYVIVGDPAYGIMTYSIKDFLSGWECIQENEKSGIALFLLPSMKKIKKIRKKTFIRKYDLIFLGRYIRPFLRPIIWLLLGMILSLVIQMAFPFLTQALVDVGIKNSDLHFIFMILGAQLILSLSILFVELIQTWILLNIVTRVNIALIADFITKMLKLPISFFDSKNTGDIMQRIGDHQRIEDFFTVASVSTFFSLFSFVIFSVILGYYNIYMLLFFVLGHIVYVIWVTLFLQIRRKLDFKRFDESAKNQSNMIQIIEGAEEIKLNGCEQKMRMNWEKIQYELFGINVKGMKVEQIQNIGTFFITNIVNTGLLAYAAWLVVKGNITLGMMMSLTYIIGQLKGPIQNFVGFVHAYQDARISLERLAEVHLKKDEDEDNRSKYISWSSNHDIEMKDVIFSYQGPGTLPVLNHLNLRIEHNTLTAIVGESGSGKTTLLKLLLGYYQPQQGRISFGNVDLRDVNTSVWRNKCAAVMQNGFIFSASISENIGIKDGKIDLERLALAAKLANVDSFVSELPLGYQTIIGQEGCGLSQGQKQRILIARAIYRDPSYIFFDEATNALDATNERDVMDNMDNFFQGRTVVVVAHRLSTVRKAHKIVVLKQGQIIEEGKHEELVNRGGYYFNLIKNQLELVK